MEAKGTGVNQHTYWVSHSSFATYDADPKKSEWQRLPDISPKQIEASRNIKVLFTGDLKRKIFTNPYFFGEERHYLRAQIARISHSTQLTARVLWRTKEESKREIEENAPEEGEIVLPSTTVMGNPNSWGHLKEGIL